MWPKMEHTDLQNEPTLPLFTTAATTKPSVFVKTTKSTVGTHPPNWPFPKEEEGANSTQKESLLVHDLKSSMAVDGLGYGSAFTVKLLEIARKKDFLTTAELFNAFSAGMNKRIDEGKLASMGQDLLGAIKRSLVMLQSDSSGLYNEDAWAMMDMVHLVVKNKNIPIYDQLRQAINLYDSMFTKAEGEELFASLEVFERYPEGGKSATEVCERIIDAFLAPYIRMDGSREQKQFVRLIMQSAESANPGWRAQDFALRMGKKKVMHQIRRRNRMKRRKHRRERRKHRRHRKRKQRERQLSMGNLSTTLTTATATTSTTTSSTSSSTTSATTTTTIAGNAAAKKLVSSYSPEYLKQLAISYFRKKQQAQNFRRFNVPSTEEEMYDNISVYSSNSTEHNNLLQKIREDSSYSDEEEHLRNNLYDALRHDNRTLVQFRAIHGEDTTNDTIRGISRESDNEWVLKNNIYKVFEKRNQVYRK
uniref:SFRICE_011755 n=1 Tax=Spodoptera frugiperda TaxID=7108 RepID=A0A2H1W8X4_SPOFR